MTKKLLTTLNFIFIFVLSYAQPGTPDTFTDGTTQGWIHPNAGSPNPPTNQTVGGIDGNYVRNESLGGGGPGSKQAIVNRSQWAGDYIAAGVEAIVVDVRNSSATETLNLRVGFADGTSFSASRYVSTNSIDIAPGTGWTTVTFPIEMADLSLVAGGASYNAVMSNCVEMRIVSASGVSHIGASVVSTLDFDNVEARTTLSTEEFNNLDFSIAPNPARNIVSITFPNFINSATLEVYNVLGKRIMVQEISSLNNRINVADWNSGIYLVKVSNGDVSQTKRLVKQ